MSLTMNKEILLYKPCRQLCVCAITITILTINNCVFQVSISMPKFKSSQEYHLLGNLKDLGIKNW
jgi:hypothetical protein